MEIRGYLKLYGDVQTSKNGKTKYVRGTLSVPAGRDADKKSKYLKTKVVFFNNVAEEATAVPDDSFVIIAGNPNVTERGGVPVFETRDGETRAMFDFVGNSIFVSARSLKPKEDTEDFEEEANVEEIDEEVPF